MKRGTLRYRVSCRDSEIARRMRRIPGFFFFSKSHRANIPLYFNSVKVLPLSTILASPMTLFYFYSSIRKISISRNDCESHTDTTEHREVSLTLAAHRPISELYSHPSALYSFFSFLFMHDESGISVE